MKKEKLIINGFLILDKPAEISSNRALQRVKWLFQAKKAGYIGTLDPFATGMLPICFGKATKSTEYLLNEKKAYRTILKLGVATESGDTEGKIIKEQAIPTLDDTLINNTFQKFIGEIMQVPPMYSALKHQGQALYEYARRGETIERKARAAKIYNIKLISYTHDQIEFEVECGKGVYIRTLGEDIAKDLNTCGHLIALRRLYCAGFSENKLVTLDKIESFASESHEKLMTLILDNDFTLNYNKSFQSENPT